MTTLTPEEFKKKYGVESLNKFDEIKKQSSISSRVLGSVSESFKTAGEQITGTGASSETSAPTRGFQLASTITGAPVKAAMSALPESVQSGLGKVGKVITTPIQWLGDKIGNIDALQKLVTNNPQATKVVEELAQIAGASSETAGNVLTLRGAVTGATKLAKGAVGTAKNTVEAVSDVTKNVVSKTKDITQGIKTVVKPLIEEGKTLIPKLKENVAQIKATESTISKLKPAAQTAVRNGVELADVNTLNNITKASVSPFKKLLKVTQDFASGKSKTNPFEVVGKPIIQGLKMAQAKATTIGQKLGNIADNLPNFSPSNLKQTVLNNLKKVRGLEGIEITPKGLLNFKNTTLATSATKAGRIDIQRIFNDAVKNGSAKSKHLLRQELFEVLGGKKKAGLQITGTQEGAFEAVRKGLSDALDSVSPQYKAVNMEYAKAFSPIQKLKKLLGTAGVDADLLDMKAGLLARRLTSFSKSNPEIRQALRDLDKVISTKGKTLLSTESLQDFYNILDKYYDIAGRTGFQGQVTAGVSKALEKGGISRTIDLVEGQFGKLLGETDIVKQKALEELLKDILGN